MPNFKKSHKDYISTFIRQGLSVIIGLLQVLLLARFLGPELNGSFGQYLVYVAFGAVLFSFGLGNALISAVTNRTQAAMTIEQAIGFLYTLYPILLLIGSFITFIVSDNIFWVCIFMCSIVVAFFNNTQCLLMAEDRFKEYNQLAVTSQLIAISFYIFVIVIAPTYNAELFIIAYFLSQSVTVVVSIKYGLFNNNAIRNINLNNFKYVFFVIRGFSFSSLITSVLFIVNAKFIFLYASSSLSAKEVGFFFLAMSIMDKVNTVIHSISLVAYPKVSSMVGDKTQYIKKLTGITLALSIALAILSAFVVKLLPWVIGANYDIYHVYLYFSASIPFIALVKFSHSTFYSYGKHRIVLVITLINLLMTLMIPLFNISGLFGMSIYFLTVNILTALLSVFFYYYFLKYKSLNL